MSIASTLYKLSRALGKTSSIVKDIEVLSTGDTAKITKRIIKKGVYKASNEVANSISKNIK